MPNSLEKIHELADEYNRPPSPDGDPLELMISSAVMTLGPTFLSILPDDPAELDAGLVVMAAKLLALRSDGAEDTVTIAELGAAGNWQPLTEAIDADSIEHVGELEAGSA